MSEGENPYPVLRQQVLMQNPAELGLDPDSFGKVWGMVMESSLDGAVVSLIVLGDCTISLYFSSGTSIVGGGEHESVIDAATTYLSITDQFVEQAESAFMFPMPEAGNTIFYFLLFDGVSSVEASENELKGGEHALSPLYLKGQDVIAELRQIEPASVAPAAEAVEVVEEVEEPAEVVDTPAAESFNFNDVPEAEPVPLPEAEAAQVAPSGPTATSEFPKIVTPLAQDETDFSTETTKIPSGREHMMYAATNGFEDKVRSLLAGGVNPEDCDETGLTPLMAAAYADQPDTMTILLEAGCLVESKDELGYTTLMFACNGGSFRCGKILVEHGADVNAKDNDNNTPIMFAAQNNKENLVKLLKDHGADPNFVGDYGLSAIDFAEQNGTPAMVAMLEG
jgi:ankyrin repeat protein